MPTVSPAISQSLRYAHGTGPSWWRLLPPTLPPQAPPEPLCAWMAEPVQSTPDYGSLPFAIGASVRQRRRPCMPRTGTCGRCHNRHSMLCWYLISLWFLDPIWQQRPRMPSHSSHSRRIHFTLVRRIYFTLVPAQERLLQAVEVLIGKSTV